MSGRAWGRGRPHRYVLERLVDGVVVETLRPRESGPHGARAEARERAGKLTGQRAYGPPPLLRVVNQTTGRVVVTYKPGSNGKAVRV